MQTSEGGWGSQDGRPVVTRHSHRVINGTQGPPGPPGTQGRPGPAQEPASGQPPSGRSVRAFPAASPTAHPGPGGRGRCQVWTDAQVWFSSAQQVTPRDALPRPPRTPHPAHALRDRRGAGRRRPTRGRRDSWETPVLGVLQQGPASSTMPGVGWRPAAHPVASATRTLAAWSWTRSVRAGGTRRRPHYVGRGHLKQIAKASQPRVWAAVTGQGSVCRRRGLASHREPRAPRAGQHVARRVLVLHIFPVRAAHKGRRGASRLGG